MGQFGLYRDNNGTHLWCWQSFLTFDDVLGYLDDLELQVVQCWVASREPDPIGFIFVCGARSASFAGPAFTLFSWANRFLEIG